jgi:fibronectin-binding autotransporter adhesin
MSKHVKAGQTFNIVGTLAAGETLIGLAGHPGAVIGTGKAPTNDGSIILYGSSKPEATGATLRDTGVLTNAGVISVGGGAYSSHAALLDVVRVLNNTGAVDALAGMGGAGGQVRIESAGALTNTGTLMLDSGTISGSGGATLTDAGMLTNAAGGIIDIDAETDYEPGGAATLTVSGVLQNSGMLTVGSTEGSLGNKDGHALLADSGTLTNSGVSTVMRDLADCCWMPECSTTAALFC